VRRTLTVLILLSAGYWPSGVGHAATVRPHITIAARHVLLSDIFSDVPAAVDCELGDAPALGAHYTMSAAQLSAIAAQYGIDWTNASHLQGVVVTRSNRTLGADAMTAVMTRLLTDRGMPANASLHINGFPAVMAPVDFTGEPTLIRLDLSGTRQDHFAATFSVPGDDAPTTLHLSGFYEASAAALVARRTILAGLPVTTDAFEIRQVPARQIPEGALPPSSDIDGLVATRTIPAGQTVLTAELEHPVTIRHGTPVVAVYTVDNLRITASGIAMDDGGIGDIVHVANPSTRTQVVGTVIDHALVSIAPGMTATPLSPQTAATIGRGGHAPL